MLQLPVLGWFTQIGLTTAAMEAFFHVHPEPALGCGAVLLLVTFMSVIPLGLIWARFEHVSLKKVAEESEHAGEEAITEVVTRDGDLERIELQVATDESPYGFRKNSVDGVGDPLADALLGGLFFLGSGQAHPRQD